MDYNTTSSFDSFELQITPASQDFLRGAAKWATIFAILGFIGLGFLVLMGIMVMAAGSIADSAAASAGSVMPFPMSVLGIVYIVMAVIYFLPIFYLYKFASDTKWALNNNNSEKLASGFKNLKSHFKTIVLIIIITIIVYIIGIAVFAVTMASSLGNM